MDSTHNLIPTTSRPISIKAAARKLPIKRKNPTSNPNPQFPNPQFSGVGYHYAESTHYNSTGGDREIPPFKYHRIWTEADEIRFLQGLIDCYNDALAFPRDLFVFYERFSQSMSQPYTKSQLGEKLRRLKKKFRVASARLGRGLDFSVLSAHDQALFELSKRLWHSDYECTSPFGKNPNFNDNASTSDLFGIVNDCFAPTLPVDSRYLSDIHSSFDEPMIGMDYDADVNENFVDEFLCDFNDGYAQINEVKIEYDVGKVRGDISDGNDTGKNVAKLIVDVFDDALKEIRATHDNDNGSSLSQPIADSSSSNIAKCMDFEKRWREQRVAEFDVLASRWRLIIENSLQRQR